MSMGVDCYLEVGACKQWQIREVNVYLNMNPVPCNMQDTYGSVDQVWIQGLKRGMRHGGKGGTLHKKGRIKLMVSGLRARHLRPARRHF